jgi:hypothetical protein
MNKKLALWLVAIGVTAFFALPSVSEAQFRGGGRGVAIGRGGYGAPLYGPGYGGYGYGGYGYGGYGYGPGIAIGRGGVAVNLGTGYGGYPYGGYGAGYGYGPGFGYSNGVVTQPSVVVGSPNTTQAFYPPTNANGIVQAGLDARGDGRGRIIVNVPANAELWWNGTFSTLTGPTRIFGTLPLANDGATQRFIARWPGQDGQPVVQSRDVRALPNTTVNVDFMQPDASLKAPN